MANGDADQSPCGECGGLNAAVARFCQHCGGRLEAASPERRKVVTVVFCDVTGSTALGERLDPEVLRALMGEFYERARTVVRRHEGSVEKFIGDAVVAVFGVPVSREDDALRAVRAAVEVQEAVRALAEDARRQYGVDLAVRTGVNTGEVVVGEARSGGSYATGDAVNTAARLEQAAAPGETVLGEPTYQLVRSAIDAEQLEPLNLRNKQEQVTAYRLLGLRTVQEVALETSFVGRVRERALLQDAFARMAETQTAAVVTVLGDAGLGKSRLVGDFLATVADRATVLPGRCLSYGDGITFWPIVEVLRAVTSLDGSESPDAVDARLLAAVEGSPDAAAVAAQLGPLLGAAGEPGAIADVTWAVQTVIEHLAERRPVVLNLDDLHWAEPALLDLVESVVRWCRDLPVFLVCQARPEFLAQRPTWGSGVANTTTIRLEPLSDADAVELIAELTGRAGVAVEQIQAAAGGNPLFLEQLVAHVREEPGRGDGALRVPPTLAALLAARLDQLDEAERETVACAAVVGQVFHIAEVAVISTTLDESAIGRALETLNDRQIVRRSREDGRHAYRFRHVLVQEAAYQAQPKAQRAQRHRGHAEWLSRHPGEAAGELDAIRGWHLEQAYLLTHELAPSDPATARLAAEAADALMDAARARSSADARAAAGLLRRAASLTVDDPRLRAERLLRAAYVQWSALTPEAVRTLLDEVEELGPPAGPAALALGRALRSMLEVTTGTGAAPTTSLVETTRRAGEICADERWAWGLAVARRLEANAFNLRAEWSKIQPLLDEVVALSEAADDPSLRDEALMYGLGVARWGPAPVEEGLVLCERVITELRDAPVTRGRAMLDQDVLQAMNGAIDGALPALTQPPPQDDLISYTFWGFCASNIAELAGDDREAARIAISAADVSASSGDVAFSSTLNAYGAFLLAGLGDVSRGRELMAIARDTSPAGDAASHAFWRLAGAIVAAADGDADEARRLAAEAIEWIDGTDQINEQADVRLRVGPALRSIGDVEHARALLAEALELYRRKGNRPMTARAEQQLAEFG